MVDENMDHRNRQPLTFAADVIVVGAGPSGISAALTAAKAGAQVLLVDEHSKPGGTLDHAGLHTICGLYLPDRSKATYVSDRARMWAQAVGNKPQRIGRVHVLPIDPGQFSQTASKMLEAQPTIQTSFNTRLQPHDHLVFRSLIDATGQASILGMAGIPTTSTEPTCPGVGFSIGGIDHGETWSSLQVLRQLAQTSRRFLPSFLPWDKKSREVQGILNLPPEFHAEKPVRLAEHAQESLGIMLADLRKTCAAFKSARLEWSGKKVGLRSGRVFAGFLRLDEEMLRKDCTTYPGIRGYWPAEWWRDLRGPRFIYPHPKGFAIPDECLWASHSPSIYTAGMSLSSSSLGQAAVRVAGVCIETGHRAGELAAQDARRSAPNRLVLKQATAT
ncbi:MAG: FAD-dependent oxidoreductase [Proteobacteria bacterium]|nr:FAD-dependent oxidoreductase [Pseudomonadota bacterium]